MVQSPLTISSLWEANKRDCWFESHISLLNVLQLLHPHPLMWPIEQKEVLPTPYLLPQWIKTQNHVKLWLQYLIVINFKGDLQRCLSVSTCKIFVQKWYKFSLIYYGGLWVLKLVFLISTVRGSTLPLFTGYCFILSK